jgi:hypothetical protein
MNLHCYVCKKYGHTKKVPAFSCHSILTTSFQQDCPDRKWDLTKVCQSPIPYPDCLQPSALSPFMFNQIGTRQAEMMGMQMSCKHCGELGHLIRDCEM